jgi:hypothetical protein
MRRVTTVPFLAAVAFLAAAVPFAAFGASAQADSSDALVTTGSPAGPFPQNKQNEPAVAVDANHPNILAAAANDQIDIEACNAGTDNTCPYTPGVGTSGVYFSFDSGHQWTQPTYTGLTARGCLGLPGDTDPPCQPVTGPIGTLPWYSENGLVSHGDPGVAFGPVPGPNGFSWANGSRLYYSNLVLGPAIKGFQAVGVSRTDDVQSAALGVKSAWQPPVLISKQNPTTFADKSQIWADNVSRSPFFGTVYVCWSNFADLGKAPLGPAPLQVAASHDGGNTWELHQVTAAIDNDQRKPMDGCTVRTDSHGVAYVFGVGTVSSSAHDSFELMVRSSDGGHTWSTPQPVAGPVTQPGAFDPVEGRAVIDGIAGARSDLAPAPSVDIANGAPTGADATDRIVITYVSGSLAQPDVLFTESTDLGDTWSTPRAIEQAGDRGTYTAPAISPNGTDVYVVYNAFTTPFRTNTTDPRTLVGVVLHATSPTAPGASTGAFAPLHRGTPGDPRGTSTNALTGEIIGDYVYAAATRSYGTALWNDARNAGVCDAINAYRQALQNGQSATAPAVEQQCPNTFGNSDIFAFSSAP